MRLSDRVDLVTGYPRKIQTVLRFHRQGTLIVDFPLEKVRHRLKKSLSQEIVLGGNFQSPRHYWGSVTQNEVILYGPRPTHRNFCFCTQGRLKQNSQANQTHLDFHIYLNAADFYSLLVLVGIAILALLLVFRWRGIIFMPLFIGFYYTMTQFHFIHFTQEITQLLYNLMSETNSGNIESVV